MNTINWMSNETIQGLSFDQLVMPGTHDTGSFSVQPGQLSELDYGNILFLWQILAQNAPINGTNPTANLLPAMPDLLNPINTPQSGTGFKDVKAIYAGQQLYNFVQQVAVDMSKSNDQSQLNQLNDGLRYFDWRLYYDSDLSGFYFQHGLRGMKLEDALADVSTFITNNSGSTELIILDVSHLNITTGSAQANELVSAFKTALPDGSIYSPPTHSGDVFQALSGMNVSDITKGSNRVILLNSDSGISYDDSIFFNASGYVPAPDTVDGTNQTSTLSESATTALDNVAQGQMARLSWSLTCQAQDAIIDAVGQLSTQPGFVPALQRIASAANAALPGFLNGLSQSDMNKINCITVDWHRLAPVNQSVVDLAIAICQKRAA